VRAFAAALLLGLVASAQAAEPDDSLLALRKGQYDAAIAGLRRLSTSRPQDAAIHRALTNALAEVGQYAEAAQTARAWSASNPRSAELQVPLGDALFARGDRAGALDAYQAAIAGRASDALLAQARAAAIGYQAGDRATAVRSFERLIAAYNSGAARSAPGLLAVGIACLHIGRDEPQAFKDALKAFDEAAAADPSGHEARVQIGELFLAKYNSSEARAAFGQVLAVNPKHPRALVGMAHAKDFDGDRGVPDLLKQALEANPNLVEAHAFSAELLIALEDRAGAIREAEEALTTDPISLSALSSLAAARYLSGDQKEFEATRAKADALYPGNGALDATLAEACVRNRLYPEAARFAARGIERDPRSGEALALLGQNQLRLGKIDDGRKSLERAFAVDPYNVWVKNTLDLLDTFPRYRTTESPSFRFFVDGKESELLTPYLSAISEEALAKLAARYQYDPARPIRVEVYRSHADFSVRTVGLAGLGALGVCFGPVVAIDSPAAREKGKFNWGSTLWHELAHTITLGTTDARIPRWLTEGISVYEERRARQGWGDDTGVEFLLAMKAERLLPLAKLNNGFVRPESPEQIGLSYYQASLVVEHLEATHGLGGLLALLRAYKDGKETAQAFQQALGVSVDAFDEGFKKRLGERFGKTLAVLRKPGAKPSTRGDLESRAAGDPEDFLAHALLGRMLFAEKRFDDARPHLERAKALWPDSAGDESPLYPLAMIAKERGDRKAAIAELQRLTSLNENHYDAHLELATLLEAEGDTGSAAALLERAVYIWPFDAALFERRAALAEKRGDKTGVVRARTALVALEPVDKAEALYKLAQAELVAGDPGAAKRHVMRALEAAPRFAKAQELLLEIHRAAGARP